MLMPDLDLSQIISQNYALEITETPCHKIIFNFTFFCLIYVTHVTITIKQ